jgi:diguanylate cyclase (GGDEF)-like protein
VLFIQLDRFKQVNDTYGHDAGDWVLRLVANRLRRHLGAQATIGHLGGDEFAALSDVGPAHGPWLVAARELVDRLTTPITLSRAS